MAHDAGTLELPRLLEQLVDGVDLTRHQAVTLMARIMGGDVEDVVLAALLTALRAKGEAADELAGFVDAMSAAAVRLQPSGSTLDTCGTGGDGADTFNISTVAAIVCAAAGARVAKHGNRSASSSCGSADLLEGLGVAIDLGPDEVAACIEELGIGFMFARRFHPAMRHVAQVRAGLGIRTVFNLLGPLCNPAGAQHQVVGVADPKQAAVMAGALHRLGRSQALVFHGHGGLDELTTSGPSDVWEVTAEGVRTWVLEPRDHGFATAAIEQLRGGDVTTNVGIARDVLAGTPGARQDVVALNAGAGLWVAGIAADLDQGIEQARAVLADGRGLDLLERWATRSRELAGG